MSEELRPCPFCGGPARVHEPDHASMQWQEVYVECVGDCGAQGEKFNVHMHDHEEPPEQIMGWARKAWNTRSLL